MAMAMAMAMAMEMKIITVCSMQSAYEMHPPLFMNFNLSVAPGSRCLLLGANGSGKTTLLNILAGKHMVLLLDEVTVDLNVVTRMDFLEFLRGV